MFFSGSAFQDSISNDSVIIFHQSLQSLDAKVNWAKDQKLLGFVNWEQSFDTTQADLSLLIQTAKRIKAP